MERVFTLNSNSATEGTYVLYWMQSAQRSEYNPALNFSIDIANGLKLPLVVYFGLTDNYPNANIRHFDFMLQGLKETADNLKNMNIGFIMTKDIPWQGALKHGEKAAAIITDSAYLPFLQEWRKGLALNAKQPVYMVETDAVFPVSEISQKEEYSAAILRRKIQPFYSDIKRPENTPEIIIKSSEYYFLDDHGADVATIISYLNIDKSVPVSNRFKAGTGEAHKTLNTFINETIDKYADKRNDPNAKAVSYLSPYLHFGQISAEYAAYEGITSSSPGKESFIEELIVRRELAKNFTHYNPDYQSLNSLPNWCWKTLDKHRNDFREHLYTLEEFENYKTHDPYWNASMAEMKNTGYMHNYMRMYWGKKVIEWTESPEEALQTLIYLNDKYLLDGRDSNGYAGIMWCFGKHDRPWKEREIFGTIRYMNDKGLKRKFDADAYAKKWLAAGGE